MQGQEVAMKSVCRIAACFAFIGFSTPALPWGAEGHETVGAIADQLLAGHPTEQKVRDILGFKLREAGPWADCIRSVKEDHGNFTYVHSSDFGRPCEGFRSPSEKERMEDYAKRNWTNCTPYSGRKCHAEYHFADVSIHHYEYSRAYKGTFEHDIVQTINAAIDKLKGNPPRAPFSLSIKDRKEAIFLLAHMVGDLHQPLHVGSVYLTKYGRLVNPDGSAVFEKSTETEGGNQLGENPSMHAEWDRTPADLGPFGALIERARQVPPTLGDVYDWAATWASESVRASHTAFTAVTFRNDSDGEGWLVHRSDPAEYVKTRDKLKRDQLAKGGAHLAELLKTLLP
jgi:hypothetical protein